MHGDARGVGSGKSTLLNILGGLDVATSGSVHFRGEELSAYSERQLTLYRRHQVGFVLQFYNLIPSLTAIESVGLVTEIATNPMRPEEALELVGLKDRLRDFPAQLSGWRATAGGYRPRRGQAPRGAAGLVAMAMGTIASIDFMIDVVFFDDVIVLPRA